MLYAAILFFVLAALLGLIMLSYVLKGNKPPKTLAFIHGPLALTGIILVIIYAYTTSEIPYASLTLFILAALGGLTMLYKHLTGKVIPPAFALGHGAAALIAFVLLLLFTFVHA